MLVFVHGGATTHRCFDLVPDGLAGHFTVVRFDRRGHGASGDANSWSFQREVEDLVELASDVGSGSGVRVVGYSFGASIALHAAASSPRLFGPLVVYEPPFGVPGLISCADEVLALLDEDRLDDAARTFITTTFGIGDGAVEAMERHPLWADTRATIHNLRRELPVIAALGPPPVASQASGREHLAAVTSRRDRTNGVPPAGRTRPPRSGRPACLATAMGCCGPRPVWGTVPLAGASMVNCSA
ncbi:MAG TPA: alpha/beta hydrolase [Acidimicrobiia bacterium]|nr:alpha/beta hydrolase [Acidimicrobiia bacterium]